MSNPKDQPGNDLLPSLRPHERFGSGCPFGGRRGKALQGGGGHHVRGQALLMFVAASWLLITIAPVSAAETLRVGFQSSGTFAWVLDVIRRHTLAQRAGLDLQVTGFASPEAGKLALNSG